MSSFGPFTGNSDTNSNANSGITPWNLGHLNGSGETTTPDGSGTNPTEYLVITNYSITGPAPGDTVNLITVTINRSANLSSGTKHIRDFQVFLVVGGSVVAANNQAATGTNWPLTAANATYNFTVSLTGSQVTASNFGVAISVVSFFGTEVATVISSTISGTYSGATNANGVTNGNGTSGGLQNYGFFFSQVLN